MKYFHNIKYSHLKMHITKNTDDYNDSLSLNNNCTNSENNIEIVIPSY